MFNRMRSMSLSSGELDSLVPEIDHELLPTELREMYETWSQSNDLLSQESADASESDWPVAIYVPERYEEGYAYPLVIWFHSDAEDENQLEQVMTAVSSQNYVGLALRGNVAHAGSAGFHWNGSSLQFGRIPLLNLLHVTTCRLRRAFHIHSERIFLAGADHGADVALQVLVQRPHWFAGAALLNPASKSADLKADRLVGLRSKPVMVSVARNCRPETMAGSVETVRLLRSAGAKVDVELGSRPVDPSGNDVRMIDHWIMHCINQEALV